MIRKLLLVAAAIAMPASAGAVTLVATGTTCCRSGAHDQLRMRPPRSPSPERAGSPTTATPRPRRPRRQR